MVKKEVKKEKYSVRFKKKVSKGEEDFIELEIEYLNGTEEILKQVCVKGTDKITKIGVERYKIKSWFNNHFSRSSNYGFIKELIDTGKVKLQLKNLFMVNDIIDSISKLINDGIKLIKENTDFEKTVEVDLEIQDE